MERSKMVVGTEYAVSSFQDMFTAEKLTLLSSDLHTTKRHSTEIVKTTRRATTGTYRDPAVGVLMETASGTQKIVYPQHVKMTYAEFVEHKAAKQQAQREADIARKARENQNAQNAKALKAQWEELDLPRGPYFSEYSGTVEVSYGTLLEILKRVGPKV